MPAPRSYWLITVSRKDTSGGTDYTMFVIDEHPIDWLRHYGKSISTHYSDLILINSLEITSDQFQNFEESR